MIMACNGLLTPKQNDPLPQKKVTPPPPPRSPKFFYHPPAPLVLKRFTPLFDLKQTRCEANAQTST